MGFYTFFSCKAFGRISYENNANPMVNQGTTVTEVAKCVCMCGSPLGLWLRRWLCADNAAGPGELAKKTIGPPTVLRIVCA